MAHKTARVLSCRWGIASPDTPVGRVFGGTCVVPQNLTNSRAIGGQEVNLYGLIEPRIQNLAFEIQSGALLAQALRGAGSLPALKFLCSTDAGSFLFEDAYIHEMHLRFAGAGTLTASLSVMALKVSPSTAQTPAALNLPVYQWHDGQMTLGGAGKSMAEGVVSFSNNLEYLVDWDGPVEASRARFPSEIKTDTFESLACRFTLREPHGTLDPLANTPGTTGAVIRAERGSHHVTFTLSGLSLAEDELLPIPGGADEVLEYHLPFYGLHGGLVVTASE